MLSAYERNKKLYDHPFECTGTIIYDPDRGTMKNRVKWWCILKTPDGILDYYKSVLEKELWLGDKLQRGNWGGHVSMIRGERPRPDKMHLWKKYHKQKVKLKYNNYLINDGKFWYINIVCDEIIAIRKEMGLPHDWSLHMTIARTKENYL